MKDKIQFETMCCAVLVGFTTGIYLSILLHHSNI